MNNVLIIEDDKEICVMIKDHLEKYNYQVFFTLTGANAIERRSRYRRRYYTRCFLEIVGEYSISTKDREISKLPANDCC